MRLLIMLILMLAQSAWGAPGILGGLIKPQVVAGGTPAAWVGPTFVASGTQVTGTGNVTPGIPTGMQTNDVMLLFVESAGSNGVAPASWTLITNAITGAFDAVNATAVDVFYRRVIAGEAFPSAPTVNDRGNHTLAVIAGFRGCETNGNPFNVYTNNIDSTTNTTVSINSLTTTVNNCLVVQVDTSMFDIATNQFFNMANANLGAFTTITNGGTVSGNGGGWWIGSGNLTNAGASGATTGYATNTTTEAAVSIALMPVQLDVTAPLLLATSSVDSTGTNWLLKFSENVVTNASLAGLVAPSNSALGTITNLTFVTGSGSNALHFYNSPQITSNGVVTYVSFTNAANAIEDLAGNDLASTNVVSVVNNSSIGSSASCPADGSPDIDVTVTYDSENLISYNTDRVLAGLKNFSNTTERVVCKIGGYLKNQAGTVTGKKYRVAIYSVSGNNLGSVITNGYSDEVSGPGAEGWVYFTWTGSKPTLAANTYYHITIAAYDSGTTTLAALDAVNYAVIWVSPSSQIDGSAAVWNSIGSIDVDSPLLDSYMRFYWYD